MAGLLLAAVIFSFAIGSNADMIQPRRLVNSHTAGVLPKGYYDFETRIYTPLDGMYGTGMMMGLSVGLTDRLDIGIMYGGDGIIGSGKPRLNRSPGVQVKYRLFEEGFAAPALAFGYDHQGYGGVAAGTDFDYDGYLYKSPGFFISASKNFLMLNKIQIGFHGSANYSLEERLNIHWPNFALGLDMGFNEELSIVLEYDMGLNDRAFDDSKHARIHKGYLNAGLRWAFTPSFYIELDFKDLLENKGTEGRRWGWSREMKIVYYSHF